MENNRFLKLSKSIQILLILLFLFVLCFIAEIGSYVYFRFNPSLSERSFSKGLRDGKGYGESPYLYYPYISYRYRPNTKGVRKNLDSDKFGFIHNGNPDRNLGKKNKGVYRIFILGGSSVAGTYVSSPQSTISGQLESKLNTYMRDNGINSVERVEVINAGVCGYNSAQELSYMIYYLLEFSPDMFIVFDGRNDFFYSFNFPSPQAWMPGVNSYHVKQFVWLNKHFNLRESVGFVINNLTEKSYFLRLVSIKLQERTKRSKVNNQNNYRPVPANAYPVPDSTECDIKNAIEKYHSNLSSMIGFCLTHNVKLGVFLQPTLTEEKKSLSEKEREILVKTRQVYMAYSQKNDDGVKKSFLDLKQGFFEEGSQMFMDLSRKYNNNIVVRDLHNLFNGNRETCYGDSCHYTDKGRDIITEAMLDAIIPLFQKLQVKQSRLTANH